MTADAFIAWTMEQPEGERYELADGMVVAMAPERARHARAKGRLYRRLAEAVEAAGLPCEVFPDGMAVVVDAETIYEPDALLRCGEPLDGDAVKVLDPVIVVEVLSPSTQGVDLGDKLAGYFRIPSLRHYLIVKPGSPVVIHHARAADGDILTRLVREMPIRLEPPGIVVDLLG
jgi:Uma2 family endonuclease